jgi:hypothetical protein
MSYEARRAMSLGNALRSPGTGTIVPDPLPRTGSNLEGPFKVFPCSYASHIPQSPDTVVSAWDVGAGEDENNIAVSGCNNGYQTLSRIGLRPSRERDDVGSLYTCRPSVSLSLLSPLPPPGACLDFTSSALPPCIPSLLHPQVPRYPSTPIHLPRATPSTRQPCLHARGSRTLRRRKSSRRCPAMKARRKKSKLHSP